MKIIRIKTWNVIFEKKWLIRHMDVENFRYKGGGELNHANTFDESLKFFSLNLQYGWYMCMICFYYYSSLNCNFPTLVVFMQFSSFVWSRLVAENRLRLGGSSV